VRVEFSGKDGGDEATAFIRLQKDSLMWLSLRGALGIEGFRVLVTKDSVKVMNLLKKTYQLRSISYLQEVSNLPFNFSNLQDLVVGNPIFIDSNIVSYKNANNQLLVLMLGKVFKHLITIDNSTGLLVHSKLDDADATRNRTSSISFADYTNNAGFPFSTKRKISVAEKSQLDINLDFKQYEFNKPLTFPFTIPKNYKRQ
jgi:outer membrane lipoprotein-sorting protein